MKPFNLERALAGDPVITRDGRQVTELHYFKTAIYGITPLFAVVDGSVISFCPDGSDITAPNSSDLDLFMAPIKREGWLVRHEECDAFLANRCIYNSENDAKTHVEKCGGNYKVIKIEWEE